MQPKKYYWVKKALLCFNFILILTIPACAKSDNQKTIQPVVTLVNLPTVHPAQTKTTTTPESVKKIVISTQDNNSYLETLLPNCSETKFSPSEEWATGYCGNDETRIINVNQTVTWSIFYGEYYGKKFDSGAGYIAPEYWSGDGKYLYLAIQRGVSGPIYSANGWALIRLDLKSGQISEILKPLQHGFYSFSLDGDNLAYIYQYKKPFSLNIVNLQTGDSKSVTLTTEYDQAGDILWSPDKTKIVLVQVKIDFEGNDPELFSIVILDLENKSSQTIVDNNKLEMKPISWSNNNQIELIDINGKSWVFDITEKSLYEISN